MRFLISLLAVMCLLTGPAMALDLQEARAKKAVGEGNNGYVVALGGDADAKALAAEVNAKRKAEYQRIAKQQNQAADVVAKLAAQEIISQLPAGSRFQDASGNWQTR